MSARNAVHISSHRTGLSIYRTVVFVTCGVARTADTNSGIQFICRASWPTRSRKEYAMDRELIRQAEPVEEILTFDVPDHVLERAANAEQQAFTLFYCTNQSYGGCGLH
jgi:hypothetical protein